MIKLIFEGIEDNITLEEFKEDYKTIESHYNNIQMVEDDGNGNVKIIYNDGSVKEFKKNNLSGYLNLL